ncbi:hypothetical protein [Bacillus sp. KH172YL63]|uniref:hypothetical protein n=1 Tax=Bacillus sp. KH172YL63 TaxID=2709784 RepID=UPI0013E42194|nr:hypothetical protein [Bacillus sp. KH172YL63]BCB02678.1 hypothetical protein KH172YL63_08110 [Bacillus sp. KH172YL63]
MNPKDSMDKNLKKLEDDYIEALDSNGSSTVEEFIDSFLYDSWDYNEQNMDLITTVMSRYSRGEITTPTFRDSFNRMVEHLQHQLAALDHTHDYPLLHSKHGASILVSMVDGLVVQYFLGVYSADALRDMTPTLKEVILNALKTPGK